MKTTKIRPTNQLLFIFSNQNSKSFDINCHTVIKCRIY